MTAKVDQLNQASKPEETANANPAPVVFDASRTRMPEIRSKEELPAAYQPYFNDPEFATNLRNELRVARSSKGHLVMAMINSGESAPNMVLSQSPITALGVFVSAVRGRQKPIGFEIHGFESVEITPRGSGPIEDLGTIELRRLDPSDVGSVVGTVSLESPNGTKLQPNLFNWKLIPPAANRAQAKNVSLQHWFKTPARVAADGSFQDSGFSPAPASYGLFYGNFRLAENVTFERGGKTRLENVSWPTAVIRFQGISNRSVPLHPITQVELSLGTNWILDVPSFGRVPFIKASLSDDNKASANAVLGTLKRIGDGSISDVDLSKALHPFEGRWTSVIESGQRFTFEAKTRRSQCYVLCEFEIKVAYDLSSE